MVIYKLYPEGFSMNMSRMALLSTVFCFTAISADEAATTQPGIISQATGFIAAPFKFVFNTTDEGLAGWIAEKSYLNAAIGQITGISFLKGSCVDKPALIGKSLVALAAIYGAYKAYQALNEQNVDNDDDMIFVDEEYVA
jgi:hypothetical protein